MSDRLGKFNLARMLVPVALLAGLPVLNCSGNAASSRPTVTVAPQFSATVYNRLAIVVQDRSRRFWRSGSLRQIEDQFVHAAIRKGYTLASRSDMDEVLRELDIQHSDLTEEALAEYARLLNVSAILLVSVNEVSTERYEPIIKLRNKRYYQTIANVSARLISAEQGQVVWLGSHEDAVTVEDRDDEGRATVAVASVVAGALPGRESP